MSIAFNERWTPDEYRKKPKEYDPGLAEAIVERLREGEMLPTICKDRDMPLPGTFLYWVSLDNELENKYIAARRIGAEVNMDLMVCAAESRDSRMADTLSRSLTTWVEKTDPTKYGARATIRTKEGDEDGGIDYRTEVQRRVDAISAKLDTQRKADEPGDSPPVT
jgi:hypothetical protein